jgi:Raf kinase inhibitor-like YbhB/YbcL family protein
VRWRALLASAGVGIGIGLAGCTSVSSQEASAMPSADALRLTSSAFAHGGAIPEDHTCDGGDLSPPLAWEGVPAGTSAFVLLVTDHDAADFVHWILTDIPGDVRSLESRAEDVGAVVGRNDFGAEGWGGPCPPAGGVHHYEFRLLALSEPVNVDPSASIRQVLETIDGSLLEETTLIGTYQRQ